MNALKVSIFTVFLIITGCAVSETGNTSVATMVIQNGNIYTMDEGNSEVQYVAVNKDRIIYAGDDKEAFIVNDDTNNRSSGENNDPRIY